MRGHEPLLAMRRRGVRPFDVWLTDSPPPRPLSDGTRMDWWALPKPQTAEVTIEPRDHPARTDLRFVVGMPVHVLIADPVRMRAFVAAAHGAGASCVFGTSHTFDPKRCEATETAFACHLPEGSTWQA